MSSVPAGILSIVSILRRVWRFHPSTQDERARTAIWKAYAETCRFRLALPRFARRATHLSHETQFAIDLRYSTGMVNRRVLLGNAGALLAHAFLSGAQTASGRKVVFEHDLPDLTVKEWMATAVEVSYQPGGSTGGSEEHTSELRSLAYFA